MNEHISLLLENKHSGDISSSTSSIKAQSDVLPSSNDSNSTPLSSENSSMKLSLTSNRVEDEQEIAKDDFLHPNSTESATFRKALEDSLSAESHGAKNQLLMSHFLIHREVPAQKLRPLLLHESMALGAMSAAVAGTIIFPLDKAKTRLQSQGGSGGLFGTLRAIVMNEGWLSLFRGLGPQLVGIAPEKALKLTVNNYLRARFKDPSTGNVSVSREIFAGVLTAFIQMLITNPYEAVKIRLQLQENGKQKSALELVKSLGLKGMYRGYEWTLLRDVPFNAIYFTLYNVLKTEFIKHKSKKCGANTNLSAKELLFAGCVSGTVASAITTPADCIKTCVQSGSQEFANVGVLGAARIIYKQNGMRGFFRGVIPRILIISPLFGITFMCFETFQKWLFPDTVHAPTVIEHPEFCLKALQKFKLQRIKEQFEEK